MKSIQDPSAKVSNLGTILGEALYRSGKSQTWLARQIGTTQAAVSQFLSGKKYPKPGALARLAVVLRLDIEDLIKEGKFATSYKERTIEFYREIIIPIINSTDIEEKIQWADDEILNGSPILAMDHLTVIIDKLREFVRNQTSHVSLKDQNIALHLLAKANYLYIRAGTTILPQDEQVLLHPIHKETIDIVNEIGDNDLQDQTRYIQADFHYVAKRYRSSLDFTDLLYSKRNLETLVLSERLKLLNYAYLKDRSSLDKNLAKLLLLIEKPQVHELTWTPVLLEGAGRALGIFGEVDMAMEMFSQAQVLYEDQPYNKRFRYTELALRRSQLILALENQHSFGNTVVTKLVTEGLILSRILNCRRVEVQLQEANTRIRQ